ncbi:MAG: hypothetical protein ABSB88_18330 [Bryobacteraceae bacterium]|jgi:hypothetical protein
MALMDLTKQLAQQALLSATQEPAAATPESPGAVIFGEIGAMQKALKDDEELVVFLHCGAEKIRVMEIYLPSPQVAVLSGVDANRTPARVVSAVEALQLVTRTAKVQPGAKAGRVNLVISRAKNSSRK